MMRAKIIFIDIDGTLLDNLHNVSAENADAIRKARNAGSIIVISTGRTQTESQYIIDTVKPDYFSGMNGSYIVDCRSGEVIFEHFMDIATAEKILKLADELGMDYMACASNGLYCPQRIIDDPQASLFNEAYKKRFASLLQPMKDLREIRPAKLFAVARDPESGRKFKTEVNKIEGIQGVSTIPNAVDIITEGYDKASSAKILSKLLDIDLKDSAAIGDSENDLELMNIVGYSIAMGSAPDFVKERCEYVVPSNDENGVAYALYNILGVPF